MRKAEFLKLLDDRVWSIGSEARKSVRGVLLVKQFMAINCGA
jgi:hypothetical protein